MPEYIEFTYSIPDLICDRFTVSELYQNYNARGRRTSFGVDMDFPDIQLSKTLKSQEFYLLRGKIESTLRSWQKKYQSHLNGKHKERAALSVEERNQAARKEIDALHGILRHTLDVNDVVNWSAIKRKDPFRIKPEELFDQSQAPAFIKFSEDGCPIACEQEPLPLLEPTPEPVTAKYSFLSKLFRGSTIRLESELMQDRWRAEVEQVNRDNAHRKAEVDRTNAHRKAKYDKTASTFEKMRVAFDEEKHRDNEALESIKVRYRDGDWKAVEEYCDLVLDKSTYPDYFPKNWVLEYRSDSRIVVIDYELPAPEQLPKIESYKYVKASNRVTEKHMTAAKRMKLYDTVIYMICIRTIHELFEADVVNALDAVGFNGLVTSADPATGIRATKTIMSVSAAKDVFCVFDLSNVDPKATFRHLKGVSAATLVDLTPIPPIIKLDTTDKRFIEGRAVAYGLDESVNIAAMDWDDFEHLIRELFEKEYASHGGEVKVTRGSSDGGVDAIAFDPDPIRGGKTVIQAKRYTNTVGVAAVRDLYGTVLNEGAMKGILVTTSDYGKDSYEFAKGKPLTLLNGSNLLALLEKHGHKARINTVEAKKLLSEQ